MNSEVIYEMYPYAPPIWSVLLLAAIVLFVFFVLVTGLAKKEVSK